MFVSKHQLIGFVVLLFHIHQSTSFITVPYESANKSGGLMLFDFTETPSLDNWTEVIDDSLGIWGGKSASSKFYLFKEPYLINRAILLTALNGTAFAGARTNCQFDLSPYDKLIVYANGQGTNKAYKIILHHNGQHDSSYPGYEQIFFVPPDELLQLYEIPLAGFQPYYRERHVPLAPPLNLANITQFALHVTDKKGGAIGYGGDERYYDRKLKRTGMSRLEIDWIKADKY
ncbi:hypothetical protein WDU94_015366 [Cyamophila willieti]